MIEVKTSQLSNGELNRGVFATVDIPQGVVFHQAPALPYPNEEHVHLEKTIFADYAFEFGENHSALLLGYGMLFNHSYTPNTHYDLNFDNLTVDFYAFTEVKAGDELLINYNGEVDNEDPLWFYEEQAAKEAKSE
ncbi:SET domain-containing protein [Paenibacillus sp. 2TAB19]|uniref:SET domain-containing protein n=1 Tax=Paenibacillus sp. 2TAB19 TaxID=3233003 RepID=UPI003F9DBAB0